MKAYDLLVSCLESEGVELIFVIPGEENADLMMQEFTKGIFGNNLFLLKTVGTGQMFVNAWGGILKKELQPAEKMYLDNYQLVALSSTA